MALVYMKPRLEIHFSFTQLFRFVFGKSYKAEGTEYLLNNSRCGIFLAIKSLCLPPDSSVGVMVYNCHSVMNAVEQAGCKLLFLDVTDEMKLDEEDLNKKASKISVLIVTHLFGIVNDVERIRAAHPHLVIIEDCAHAYGLEELYGDFATFSIGQGKLPSIGDGGILKVLNPKYRQKVDSLYFDLPDYTKIQSAKLLLKLMACSIMQSSLVYGWLTLPIKRKLNIPKNIERIVPMKMCKGIGSIFEEERTSISRAIAGRKRNAQRLMSDTPEGVIKVTMGQNAFMLVLHCNNPAAVKDYYQQRGVETATHFANSIRWAEQFGYLPKQCPNAENLVNKLLMVPVYL